MQKEFGAALARDDDMYLKATTRESEGKTTVTYTVKIKTKFEKKMGVENVKLEKESGEWKVADYTIEAKS